MLLILAGIAIAALSGENGILTRASEAKQKTGREEVVEKAKIEILEEQTEKQRDLTNEEAYKIIAKYDKDYKENEEFEYKKDENNEEYIITENGDNILVKEIWIKIGESKDEFVNFIIADKSFTAKKSETWKEWLNRMKNESKEVLGTELYNAFNTVPEKILECERQGVSYMDYGGIVYSLYRKSSEGATVCEYNDVITQRRILF